MINFDNLKDDFIIEVMCENIAVSKKDGVRHCYEVNCDDCIFSDINNFRNDNRQCSERARDWLKAEYKGYRTVGHEIPYCKAFHIYVTEPGPYLRHLNFLLTCSDDKHVEGSMFFNEENLNDLPEAFKKILECMEKDLNA